MAAPGASYEVFVSYAGEDLFIARSLARMIENAGAGAFVFDRDAQAGESIDEEIRQAAAKANELLVVMTPQSIRKPYVIIEIGMFFSMRKSISGLLHRIDARTLAAKAELPSDVKGRNLLPLHDASLYIEAMTKRKSAAVRA